MSSHIRQAVDNLALSGWNLRLELVVTVNSVIFINIYKFIINFFNYLSTGSVDITAQSRELYNELIHEETVLLECTNKMESNEKTIATLISKLKEAIKEEVTNYSPQW